MVRLKEHSRTTVDTEVSVERRATLGIAIPMKLKVLLSFQNSDILDFFFFGMHSFIQYFSSKMTGCNFG